MLFTHHPDIHHFTGFAEDCTIHFDILCLFHDFDRIGCHTSGVDGCLTLQVLCFGLPGFRYKKQFLVSGSCWRHTSEQLILGGAKISPATTGLAFSAHSLNVVYGFLFLTNFILFSLPEFGHTVKRGQQPSTETTSLYAVYGNESLI